MYNFAKTKGVLMLYIGTRLVTPCESRVIDQWSATRSSRTPIPRKREGRIIAPLYKLIVHISSYSGPKTFLPSCLPGVAVAAQSRRPKTRNIGQNYV